MSAQSASPATSSLKSSRLFQSMRGSFSATPLPVTPPPPAPLPVNPPDDFAQPEVEVGLPAIPHELVNDDVQSQELIEVVPQEAQEELTQVLHRHVDTLNPSNSIGGGAAKEAPMLSVTVEHPAIDVVPGMQQVEVERAYEMPPEVEGFLKTVEDHHDQVPQEIVISNPQTGQALPKVMAQPVIVLPLTPQIEDDGKKKATNFSVRWLIEWSWKMMKIFSGKVVYRKM